MSLRNLDIPSSSSKKAAAGIIDLKGYHGGDQVVVVCSLDNIDWYAMIPPCHKTIETKMKKMGAVMISKMALALGEQRP